MEGPSTQGIPLTPKSTSDTIVRLPHRLAPLSTTTFTKKRRKKKSEQGGGHSSSSENLQLRDMSSTTTSGTRREPAAETSSGQGLMTANMLEKLKARLENEDIKLVPTDSSSSHATAAQTVSTGSTGVTTAGTEMLSAAGDPVSAVTVGENNFAWQEPEPQVITQQVSDDAFQQGINRQPSYPHKLHRSSIDHPSAQPNQGLSQATFTKQQPEPSLHASSSSSPDPTIQPSPERRSHSSSPSPVDQDINEQKQVPGPHMRPLSKLQLPKFYKSDREGSSENQTTSQRRSLPEFPTDNSIMVLRDSVTEQDPVEVQSQPQNPWQMLTSTDVVEVIDAPVKLEDLRGVPRYRDLSQSRQRSSEANIFTERRDGRGFVRKAAEAGRSYDDGAFSSVSSQITGTQCALFLYNFTQHFAVAMHGLITGISLWDSVVVNYVGRTFGHLQILQYFHQFALPLHAIHYFCLSVVLVSLLERLDVGKCSQFFIKSFLRNLSQFLLLFVIVLVLLALVLSLMLGAFEERIALFPSRPSLWSDLLTSVNKSSAIGLNSLTSSAHQYPSHRFSHVVYIPSRPPASSTILSSYMGLLLARACFCLLSWLAVIFIRNFDRLKDQIEPGGRGKSRRISRTSFSVPPVKNIIIPQKNDAMVPI